MDKTLVFFLIDGEMWWKKLESYKTIKLDVLGFVDDAHTAADLFEYFIHPVR